MCVNIGLHGSESGVLRTLASLISAQAGFKKMVWLPCERFVAVLDKSSVCVLFYYFTASERVEQNVLFGLTIFFSQRKYLTGNKL